MPAQIPQRKERTHATLPDRVPQPRIYRAWNVPQTGTDDATRLELIANILGGGNSSRLSRRLVHEDKLADSASAFAYIQEIAGNFILIIDRSEEHTSELQSLMRISYAVFCLKKQNNTMLPDQSVTLAEHL